MKIIYSLSENGANPITLTPALTVVACDPRVLRDVMPFTREEHHLFSELQNFTFYTTTLRVYPVREQDKVVILDPLVCEKMAGLVHGYRNETAKQFGLGIANSVLPTRGANIITTYQLAGVGGPASPAVLETHLAAFLTNPPAWWPFAAGRSEIVRVEETQQPYPPHHAVNPLLTPYFNHFPSARLAGGYPWQWFDLQGKNDTVYVHASTYFESVLHCWTYIRQLLTTQGARGLPTDRSAQIVIIGAGVSGLLVAHRLHQLGHTNVLLLENTDRYGGKTHTLQVPTPQGVTVCELGTCYMSYAYDELVADLQPFTVGNKRIPIGFCNERGIVSHENDPASVIDYEDYGLRYACRELKYSWPLTPVRYAELVLELAALFAKYARIHEEIFGSLGSPMPLAQPADDPYGVFTRTFGQFLCDNGLGAFIGFLEYTYEVQGYGSLDHIPAYYGLVWVSPDMVEPFGRTAGVTGWAKGWEDVWEQLVEKLRLEIRLNAHVLRITRQ